MQGEAQQVKRDEGQGEGPALTPISSTIILSRPEGPKELLTTLAIAWVARTKRIYELASEGIDGAGMTRGVPFWSRMSDPDTLVPPKKRVPFLGCSNMEAMLARELHVEICAYLQSC